MRLRQKKKPNSLCHRKLRSCLEIEYTHKSTKYGSNIKYDNYKSCQDVLTDIKNKKVDNIMNNSTSQNLVIKSLWEESTTYGMKIWQNAIKNLPTNIFNFVNRYVSNTLPTSKNMVKPQMAFVSFV